MRSTIKGVSKRQISRTLSAFYETPWVLEPTKLAQVLEVLESRAERRDLDEKIKAFTAGVDQEPRERMQVVNDVAVIGVNGILAKRMNLITEFSGGTSTEVLTGLIRRAAENKKIKGIVLDMDSPGRAANGMHEPVEAIKAARKIKPVYAVVNESMNSGAYWIGSAADKIVTLPTGDAGSIGVFTVHRDKTDLEGSQGIKTTVVRSPVDSFKATGMMPLTEDAKGDLQRQTDHVFDLFAKVVAENRGMSVGRVAELKARTYMGQEAIDVGLADKIGTLEEVIEELGARRATVPSSAVRAYIPVGV